MKSLNYRIIRSRGSILLGVVLLVLSAFAPASAAGPGNGNGNGNGNANGGNSNGNGGPPAMVDVIVTFDQTPGNSDKERIKNLGGKVKHEYRNFKMLALTVPETALNGLSKGNGVRSVVVDSKVSGFSKSAKKTAKLPKSDSPHYTTVDSNVGVAVLDSGLESNADLNVAGLVDIVAPPEGCGGGDYGDSFDSYSYDGDSGARPWTSSWVEYGENNGPNSGSVRIRSSSYFNSYALRMGGTESTRGISRSINLGAATEAALSFDWRISGDDDEGGSFRVQARTNGGSWSTLRSLYGGSGVQQTTVDLTSFVDATTEIRFLLSGDWEDGYVYIDNVQIAHSEPTEGMLYLDGIGDGTDVPVADLTRGAPTQAVLDNFDPHRNGYGGLQINKGGSLYETDGSKYQLWLMAAGDIRVQGPSHRQALLSGQGLHHRQGCFHHRLPGRLQRFRLGPLADCQRHCIAQRLGHQQ